ncbi:hypothetical protein Taro_012487 [Colocasia esculenta]|uniref:Dol-P-Glc:Glc(2)Man(9)GlcNAc(2)-PP-Dol alpha-1,2-glucosyltransferase n=1 Tax=Colocasia esculenta TaxID=4460 RepID=A0A843UJ76_COLES|nr:hypothetical protein [Colocasia esculenta]
MGKGTVAAVVSLWVVSVSLLVNRIVPEPYMDEVFHIPQAQRYCRGDFRSWDPMITTPPGLYYLSLAFIGALFPGISFMKASLTFPDLCSASVLRSTNGALAIVCSIIIYDILIHLRPAISERRATMYAICIALYPVHWFFTFLYYTDVASVTTVLAMYLASLKGCHWISSLFGATAVLIRQTNVIWMLFIASNAAIVHAETIYEKYYVQSDYTKASSIEKDVKLSEIKSQTTSRLRRRTQNSKSCDNTFIHERPTSGCSFRDTPGLFGELCVIFLKMWFLKWKLLISFIPFVLVLAAFVTFVFWNGSIVLGAKEDHAVSLHFAQIMYLGLASAAATAPMHFSSSQFAYLLDVCQKKKLPSFLQWFFALIIGSLAVHNFSIAHPYLLADNRHYTFYFWRKIIQAHWSVKYLLVPVYIYSWFSIISILVKSKGKIWALLFFLACSAVLIPAPLIEFRYYTIPIVFFIMNSQIDDNISWMLIAVLSVAVNLFTMLMFLLRPFKWAHEPGSPWKLMFHVRPKEQPREVGGRKSSPVRQTTSGSMFHRWIQPKEELCHHAGGERAAAAAHARDHLAFGRGSCQAKGPLSICSGKRPGALRRAFADACRRPVPMQKGDGIQETDGAEEGRNPQPSAGGKFRLFRYSFLVEEESLVQFDAEGGNGSDDDDGRCRRKVLVVLNPERGCSTYEMVVRQERRRTPSMDGENIHVSNTNIFIDK